MEHTKLSRALEKKGFHFVWTMEHQEAFNRIKSLLAEDMLLALYDRKKPVTLQCDYSENGLGAALVQDGRPVRFASKGLVNNKEDYRNVGCCVWYTKVLKLLVWAKVYN